jgi:hypothetical protein
VAAEPVEMKEAKAPTSLTNYITEAYLVPLAAMGYRSVTQIKNRTETFAETGIPVSLSFDSILFCITIFNDTS